MHPNLSKSDRDVEAEARPQGGELVTFAEESEPRASGELPSNFPWKVLVVDDEPDMHAVTRLALQSARVDGQPIELLSAFTAQEASGRLLEHPDTGLVLLDVVMESESAGLDLVARIRKDLGLRHVRIVLRTGQPGQAAEPEVARLLDIHDYLSKSETTTQRLTTCVLGGLRAYRDLRALANQREALRQVLIGTNTLLEAHRPEDLLQGLLQQLTALLAPRGSSLLLLAPPPSFEAAPPDPTVIAGLGRYQQSVGLPLSGALDAEAEACVRSALAEERAIQSGRGLAVCSRIEGRDRPVVYLEGTRALDEKDLELCTLLTRNAALALQALDLLEAAAKAGPTPLSVPAPPLLAELLPPAKTLEAGAGPLAVGILAVDLPDPVALQRLLDVAAADLEAYGTVLGPPTASGVVLFFPSGARDALRAASALAQLARAPELGPALPVGAFGLGLGHGPVEVGALRLGTQQAPHISSRTLHDTEALARGARLRREGLLLSPEVHDAAQGTELARALQPGPTLEREGGHPQATFALAVH